MLPKPPFVSRRMFLKAAVGLPTAAVGGYASLYLAKRYRRWKRDYTFNSARWRADPDSGGIDNARSKMVDDLLANYLRRGTPRTKVLEWLGKPDSNYDGDIYWLGYFGWICINPKGLEIQYDKTGRLLSANVFES